MRALAIITSCIGTLLALGSLMLVAVSHGHGDDSSVALRLAEVAMFPAGILGIGNPVIVYAVAFLFWYPLLLAGILIGFAARDARRRKNIRDVR